MSIKNKFVVKRIISIAKHIIAPSFCRTCKVFLDQEKVFCDDCLQQIKPIVSTTLQITKAKSVSVFAVSDYQYPMKALILAKGWSDISASKQLGQLIWQKTYIQNLPVDYFVPIPLHWTRYAWRGYNQAHQIAYELSRVSGKPVVNLLKRKQRTVQQAKLSVVQRDKNVKDIFGISHQSVQQFKNKHIVLVDDLMTSGATLRAAARLLFALKPASIRAVVGCRVI